MTPSAAAGWTAGCATGWPRADRPPQPRPPSPGAHGESFQRLTLMAPCPPARCTPSVAPPAQTRDRPGPRRARRTLNHGLDASFVAKVPATFSPAQAEEGLLTLPGSCHAPEGLSLAPQPSRLSPCPCLQGLRVPTLRTFWGASDPCVPPRSGCPQSAEVGTTPLASPDAVPMSRHSRDKTPGSGGQSHHPPNTPAHVNKMGAKMAPSQEPIWLRSPMWEPRVPEPGA